MNILIVDDDRGVCDLLVDFISELEHKVQARNSGEDALAEFIETGYDLIFLDLQMPGMDGFEVLRKVKEINNDCEIVIITAYGSVDTAIQALNMGAYAYINKPFEFLELERIIARVRELVDLRQAYRLLANERLRSYALDNLIANSPAMRSIKEQIVDFSENTTPALIIGEAGAGKRYLSRIIHFNSIGKETLILQLNAEDIESLLQTGKFLHSDNIEISLDEFPDSLIQHGYGTVILNQINNLSLDSMDRMWRLLCEKMPLKEIENRKKLRIIALLETPPRFANPKLLITDDLWSCFPNVLIVPPLRERTGCVVSLAQLFLQSYVSEKGGNNFYISQPVKEFLRLYDWPGNISELKFMMDRLAVVCLSRVISASHLRAVQKDYREDVSRTVTDLGGLLTQAEKKMISRTFLKKDSN